MLEQIVFDSLNEAHSCLSRALTDETLHHSIVEAANRMVLSFQQDGKVLSCGNGGSMSDAMHFAEELSGRFRGNRKALPAMAISDPGHLTCTANDFGYDYVFSRYVEAHFRANDVLLAISTSGNSVNTIEAARAARLRNGTVVALTGSPASPLGELSDIHICTPGAPSGWADRIQEMHIKVIHILIQLIEHQLFNKK